MVKVAQVASSSRYSVTAARAPASLRSERWHLNQPSMGPAFKQSCSRPGEHSLIHEYDPLWSHFPPSVPMNRVQSNCKYWRRRYSASHCAKYTEDNIRFSAGGSWETHSWKVFAGGGIDSNSSVSVVGVRIWLPWRSAGIARAGTVAVYQSGGFRSTLQTNMDNRFSPRISRWLQFPLA